MRRPVRRRRATTGSGRCRWAALLAAATVLFLHALVGSPAVAQPLAAPDCAEAPALERPGDGAVGSMDPAEGQGAKDSLYNRYSYAGFVWHTYDQHMGPVCGEGFAGVTTWVGNRIFDAAKFLVGVMNGLHYMQKHGGVISQFDEIVAKGSAALYNGAAIPYIGFGLALVAVAAFVFAIKGNMAATSKTTARVLVGLGIMAATALTPLVYTGLTDSILVDGVDELEANMYQQMVPGDVLPADVLPTLLHQRVVVENWAIGEFGSFETDYAKNTTARLVDAQAWSFEDIETRRDADDAAQEAKQQEYKKIAEEIKNGAANYAAFSGDGSSRMGASVFAFLEALCLGLFQLVCKAAILLAQLVLRMAILAGPAIGLLAFAPGVARSVVRAIAGVLAQGLILSAAAVLHALIMVWIMDSQVFGGRNTKLLLMLVVTVLLWAVLKPWRRLKNMAAAAVGLPALSRDTLRLEQLLKKQFKQAGGGWWNRIKRGGRWIDNLGRRTVETPKDQPGQPRPETAPVYDAEFLPAWPVRTGRRRDPGFSYMEGAWSEAHTPDPRRRPELAAARAGLPPGSSAAGRAEGDGGEGHGPGHRPGGSGAGGGGARPESSHPGHSADPPRVVEGLVIPSEQEARERWLAAERGEIHGVAPPADPSETRETRRVTPVVYRPSTGRVEEDTERRDPRPESAEPSRDTDDDRGGN